VLTGGLGPEEYFVWHSIGLCFSRRHRDMQLLLFIIPLLLYYIILLYYYIVGIVIMQQCCGKFYPPEEGTIWEFYFCPYCQFMAGALPEEAVVKFQRKVNNCQ